MYRTNNSTLKTSYYVILLFMVSLFLINPLLAIFVSLPIYSIFLPNKGSINRKLYLIFFEIQLVFLALLLTAKDITTGTHNDIAVYLSMFSSYGDSIDSAVRIGLQYIGSFDYFFIITTYALERIFDNPGLVLFVWVFITLSLTAYSLINFLQKEALIAYAFILSNINLFVLFGNAIRQAFSLGILALLILLLSEESKTKDNEIKLWIAFILGLLSHNSFIIFLPLLVFKRIVFRLNVKHLILGLIISIPSSLLTIYFLRAIASVLPFSVRQLDYYNPTEAFSSTSFLLSLVICIFTLLFSYLIPKKNNRKLVNSTTFCILISIACIHFNYTRIYAYILIVTSIQFGMIPSFFSKTQQVLVKLFLLLICLVLGILFWTVWFEQFGNYHFGSSLTELLTFTLRDYIERINDYILTALSYRTLI